MKRKAFALLLSMFTVLTSCSMFMKTESYEDASKNVLEQSIPIVQNIEIPEDGIYKVYKYLEDNTYFILSKSRLGNTILSAHQVLTDGMKIAIDNINNFLLDANVASVELVLEPGVPVQGIQLSSRTYTGLFLGNQIETKLSYNVLPADASNKQVKFFSSNPNVIRVDGRGNIRILKPGTATVTVLTLEGGFKEMCFFKIEEGQKLLKDTIEFTDYTSSGLVNNRYDDFSLQESELNSVTKTPIGDIVVAAGTRTKKYNEFVGIVYYGLPNEETQSGALAEIDPSNTLFSESLSSIVHSTNDDKFYTVGYAQINPTSKHKGLIASLKTTNTDIGKKIEVDSSKVFTTSDDYYTQFTSIVAVKEYLYVAVREFYDPGFGFETTEQRFARSYIYKFDQSLNVLRRTQISQLHRISQIGYNESENVIFFAGEDSTGIGVMGDFAFDGDLSVRIGYTSITDDIKINDIVQIANDSYAIVGETIIKGVKIGNLQTFSLSSDRQKFNSNGLALSLHDDAYELASFKSMVFNDGIITVLGYAELTLDGNRNWWNPFTWGNKIHYGYGMAVNFDVYLQFISGYKYSNSQKNHGYKQSFNDAVLMTGGEITAVGFSNYRSKNNEDSFRGYVQYDVSLLGINISAKYPVL